MRSFVKCLACIESIAVVFSDFCAIQCFVLGPILVSSVCLSCLVLVRTLKEFVFAPLCFIFLCLLIYLFACLSLLCDVDGVVYTYIGDTIEKVYPPGPFPHQHPNSHPTMAFSLPLLIIFLLLGHNQLWAYAMHLEIEISSQESLIGGKFVKNLHQCPPLHPRISPPTSVHDLYVQTAVCLYKT